MRAIYFSMIMTKDLKIAKKISGELKQKLGDKLISVILYGSRARGTAKGESDMDLFLLMQRKTNFYQKDFKKIIDITVKYWLKDNIFVSPVVYGLREFKERENDGLIFAREVKKGIKVL